MDEVKVEGMPVLLIEVAGITDETIVVGWFGL